MRIVMAIFVSALAMSTGCSSWRDSVHAESSADLARQRKEWQQQIEQRLKQIDREMDELSAKANLDANVTKMKAKNRYYDRMAELEKQRTDTRQKYESLRKATDQKWEQLKGDVEKAADAMEAGWKKFLEELKS